MCFIGIISEEKIEKSIKREILKKLNVQEEKLVCISETNINNIKNSNFETIIITRNFEKKEELREILKNAKYIIINSDIESNLDLLKNINTSVITYGFNNKSTITASSVEKDEILLCLQRTLKNKEGIEIEPQEMKVNISKNVNLTMAIETLLLLYRKNNI